MNSDAALLAFLETQRAAYRASLPGRLQALETLWHEAAADPLALRALALCVHGIAGSAATFGLPALGDTARALELALEDAAPQAPTGGEIARRYQALRQQLRAAVGAP